MAHHPTDQTQQVNRIFDRLRTTPEEFARFKDTSAAREVAGDEIRWEPVRPSRPWALFSSLSFLWQIDLDTLGRELREMLDGLGVGYCYMLKRNNKIVHLGASGWAQIPGDGDVPWLFHIPMHIASNSKFITAIAIVRLLRDLDLPVTTPIRPFLPQYWERGPGIEAITFENLMRHESGLGGTIMGPGGVTFQNAKTEIEIGSIGTGAGMYDYTNINFTILRVMFATLTGAVDPSIGPAGDPVVERDNLWNFLSLTAYTNYVNDVVFTTAGLYPQDFNSPDNAAKAYATPAASPGLADGNTSFGAGTIGWHLSIGQLLSVLGELRRGGSIMGTWRARRMIENQYGLDGPIPTNAGSVFFKSGSWGFGMQRHDSAVFMMPRDVELAVFVNSVPAGASVPNYLNPIPQLIADSAYIDFNVFRVP